MPNLFAASLTGADDKIDPESLVQLSLRYPFVEWAILYFPEKEGEARNPSREWRLKFAQLRQRFNMKSALHLCGFNVFNEILRNEVPEDFLQELRSYDRIQLNINARKEQFDAKEVMRVYDFLAARGHSLILQCHPGTQSLINGYLAQTPYLDQLGVLYDASRGKGVLSSEWAKPLEVVGRPIPCGYAGGLSPENIETSLAEIDAVAGQFVYWVDMETGLRTENEFDLAKAQAVLGAVRRQLLRSVN